METAEDAESKNFYRRVVMELPPHSPLGDFISESRQRFAADFMMDEKGRVPALRLNRGVFRLHGIRLL